MARTAPVHPTYLTLRQFAARHPAWTQGALRALHYRQASNGLEGAFRRLGRKILIDEDCFFALFEAAATTSRHAPRRTRARLASVPQSAGSRV